jgi:hypothetical protein
MGELWRVGCAEEHEEQAAEGVLDCACLHMHPTADHGRKELLAVPLLPPRRPRVHLRRPRLREQH